MNKKLMSSVLAGVMAVSTLSVPAMAASKDKSVTAAGSTTYKVSATVAEAEINVTVPGAMSAVVNPYGIEIMMKGEKYGKEGFTSAVYTIKNNTITSAVKVSATPTIVVPVDKTTKAPTIAIVATDADVDTKEADGDKAMYAYVAGVACAQNGAVTANVAANAEPAANLDIIKADGTLETNAKSAVFEDATGDDKTATHTKTDLMVIPKAEADTDGKTVKTYGFGQIVMGGKVTNTNVTPWSKSDKLTVNLVLDIAPCADDATLGTGAGGGGGAFTYEAPTGTTGQATGTGLTIKDGSNTDYEFTAADGSARVNIDYKLDTGYSIKAATSNDTDVATVNGNGAITAAGVGTTTVTVEIEADSAPGTTVTTLTIDVTITA